MKKTLFLLLLLTGFISQAQQIVTPMGNVNQLNSFAGGLQVGKILVLPRIGNSPWFGRTGDIAIDSATNKLKYYDGNGWVFVPNPNQLLKSDTLSLLATKKNLKDTAISLRDAIFQSQAAASPFIQYAYDRTIDSIDIYGYATKYVKLYRKNQVAVLDSFIDNNTLYVPGYGLLLNGTQFEIDPSRVYNRFQVDSIIENLTDLTGISPIEYDPATKSISLQQNGILPGLYAKVFVNQYGLVEQGLSLVATDIPQLPISKIDGLSTNLTTLSGNDINNITFSGTNLKTQRITKNNGAWIEGTFVDLDNQILSLTTTDTLAISGGNGIKLPYLRHLPGETYQSFTGTATNIFTLPQVPRNGANVFVTLNNAWIDPVDWSRIGSTVTLTFTTAATDLITIYYQF